MTMKRIVLLMLSLALLAPSAKLGAQTLETLKARKALVKETKSALNARASKDARKEAKRLSKDGWQVPPGTLPLEKQLDRVYLMQYEFDENMYPKYILGDATSIGENYDAAKFQAMELAKVSLASQIETEVTGLIDTEMANMQLSAGEAASVSKTTSGLKSLLTQKIGRVLVPVECFRTLQNKNKEVRVMIAYDSQTALEQAKSLIREQLAAESAELVSKLDGVIGK